MPDQPANTGGKEFPNLDFTVLGPPRMGEYVAQEMAQLGAGIEHIRPGAVEARADLATLYRVLLLARTAGRVLVPIHKGAAGSDGALYETAMAHAWEKEIPDGARIAVDFRGTGGWLRNSLHGARRVKDAVVDRIRASGRERPDVDPSFPDVLIHARFHRGRLQLFRDLGAGSLHRRGYRSEDGEAPMKEHLAAALLIAADWPRRAAEGQHLLDPVCGSGTLVIEAALMALGRPARDPGRPWGFAGWPVHQPELWQEQCRQARDGDDNEFTGRIIGSDADSTAVSQARANAEAAGVAEDLVVAHRPAARGSAPGGPGVVVGNLPYGERIGNRGDVLQLAASLGRMLRSGTHSPDAWLLCGDPNHLQPSGMRFEQIQTTRNGGLDCHLLQLTRALDDRENAARDAVNRLEKNLKHLRRKARNWQTDAVRLFDHDLPDFPLCVEQLGSNLRIKVQPARGRGKAGGGSSSNEPEHRATMDKQARLAGLVEAAGRVTGTPPERVHVCVPGQTPDDSLTCQVREGDAVFRTWPANPEETGLDLRQRHLREHLARGAAGQSVLILFADAGAAAVRAALGGARETLTLVDSEHDARWAREQGKLNRLKGTTYRVRVAGHDTWTNCVDPDRWDHILLALPETGSGKAGNAALSMFQRQLDSCPGRLSPKGEMLLFVSAPEFEPRVPHGERFRCREISRSFRPEDVYRTTRARYWLIETAS